MNKKEAFKYVCSCVVELIDPRCGHDNMFLETGPDGLECSKEDYLRNKEALIKLCDELNRRSKHA